MIVYAEVHFDLDLPEFETKGGVNAGANENEYVYTNIFSISNFINLLHSKRFSVSPAMWVKAIDIVMRRLVINGADLTNVAALSGSAQQHGSIFWSSHGINTLKNLDSMKCIHLQIDDSAFLLTQTPVWMDGSTETQCNEMENAVGGRFNMLKTTGSKCYPRFTGPQIRKVYQERKHAYEESLRISLVSSFFASIFLGHVAPIEYADASGMNLFDINSKIWSKACLNACAPDLEVRLGKPVKQNVIIGNICQFFVKRFGIPKTCKIAAFTGDNPSALAGMVVKNDWLIISLGTSDTIITTLDNPSLLEEGHVFCHPTEEEKYMGLLWYVYIKNMCIF